MKPRALGGLTALAVLFADQASKLWLLHGLGMVEYERIAVAPFFNLTMAFNPGISFSLFPQGTESGRWILLGLTLAATIFLSAWLWRAGGKVSAVGLGAIVGGALGNGVDRFAYGVVVDFIDLHASGYHFYTFNVADAAINVGVALLLYDGLFGAPRAGALAGEKG